MGLSGEQAERLKVQLRRVLGGPDLPRETWRLGVAATYLQRLRAAVAAAANKSQQQLIAIRSILTPAQFVRLAAWSERNRTSILSSVMTNTAAATTASSSSSSSSSSAASPTGNGR